MDRISKVIQGTDEWKAVKLGMVSASHIHEIMASGKGGKPSITRDKYMVRLIKERLTGEWEDTFSSASMQRGTEEEDAARKRYEAETLIPVEEVGFYRHATIEGFGCSPDGLAWNLPGLVEIKNRDSHNHIKRIEAELSNHIAEAPDRTAMLQTQGQMSCTDAKWCDYVHYDSRWPVQLQYHTLRIERSEPMIYEIERAVKVFLREMEARIEMLLKRG